MEAVYILYDMDLKLFTIIKTECGLLPKSQTASVSKTFTITFEKGGSDPNAIVIEDVKTANSLAITFILFWIFTIIFIILFCCKRHTW